MLRDRSTTATARSSSKPLAHLSPRSHAARARTPRRLAAVIAACAATAGVCASLGVAFPSTAYAQQPGAKERYQAQKLLGEAQALTKAGKLEEALAKLDEADTLNPAPDLKVLRAELLMELGRLVKAGEVLKDASEATPVGAAQKKAVEKARSLIAEVDERTPTVQVLVRGPDAASAVVTLDDEEIEVGLAIPVDPGTHEIVARAGGVSPKRHLVTLKESAREKVEIELGGGSADDTGEVADDDAGFGKAPAVVSFAVGGAALAAGIGLGVLAVNTTQEVIDTYNCGDSGVCHPPANLRKYFEDDLNAAQIDGNLSTALFVVSGVGVAAGAVLWVLSDESQKPDEPEGAKLVPLVGPGFLGLGGRF